MIIEAILGEIVKQVTSLTIGTTLFAIQGRADKNIVVNVTSSPGEPEIPEIRHIRINILAKGYGAKDGYTLSEDVAKAILAAEGDAIGVSDSDKGYEVMGVIVTNWPISYTTEKGIVYTTNISMSYKKIT